MVQPLWKWYGDPQNIKELPYDSAILLLGIYSKEVKARTQNKYLLLIVTEVLVTIAKR